MSDSKPLSKIIILTGLSGSGKTTALRALEDLDFFCIDNLPIVLLPRLLELGAHTTDEIGRLALVIDVREAAFLPKAPRLVREAREQGHDVEVLFLETSDELLLRRFSETRRRHPLATTGQTVEAAISKEREALAELRHLADQVVDTSRMSVHELKRVIQDRHTRSEPTAGPQLTVLSFGFKHGLPSQADLVFDCRFLRNPYFVDELKEKTGQEPEVADYVFAQAETKELLSRIQELLTWLIPLYRQEGKSYLTIAIGCTGGHHRSVALSEALAGWLTEQGHAATLRHRDIES